MLTDGTRRRETNFATVRWNESATMGRSDPYRLFGPEHFHRFDPDQEERETTAAWTGGVGAVVASTSQGYADGRVPARDRLAPRRRARRRPGHRLALQPAARPDRPVLAGHVHRAHRPHVRLGLDAEGRCRGGPALVRHRRPAPRRGRAGAGRSRTYAVDANDVTSLRIEAAGRDLQLPGSFGLAEVRMSRRRDPALPRPAAPRPRDPGRRDHDEPRPRPVGVRARRERAALQRPARLSRRGR